jgi:hypothetical protein
MSLKSKLLSVHLGRVLVSVQDRCMVCIEHTIGSEIVLEAPDGMVDDVRHVKSHFGLFGDSVSIVAR